jgi:hypothetical protein
MAKIMSRMSEQLGEICQAIANGQLSREKGEYLARERYQVAMMQFQLFSAWHAILEQAVAQASAAQTKDDPSAIGQALLPPLPFSSLHLNSSLAKYLELTPEQISALGQVMARERPYVAPLLAELDSTRQKLESATRNPVPTENSIALKKREQHSRGNEFLGLRKHLSNRRVVNDPPYRVRSRGSPPRGLCIH